MLNPALSTAIKSLSTGLITAILGLQLWTLWTQQQLPDRLHLVLNIGYGVLALHAIEGILAAFYARTRGKAPLSYGLYTFFVGFPSLLALWGEQPQQRSKRA